MQRSQSQSEIDILSPYSTSEVSDALSKLGISCCLSDIQLRSPNPYTLVGKELRICGPAYTVEFVLKEDVIESCVTLHHVDTCPKGSIIVIKSPANAPNAVWGGLMTARANYLGVKGVVIEGRVRDLIECQDMGFPVFCKGQSTLGAYNYSKVHSVGSPISLCADSKWPVLIKTGDIILADRDGVVSVPIDLVPQIARMCCELKISDDKCMHDIKNGKSVVDALKEHRM